MSKRNIQSSDLPSSVVSASSLVFPVVASSGDSTGVTDLAAIVAQVSAATATGGGTVRLRTGQTYTVDTPNSKTITYPSGGTGTLSYGIQLPSNVTLDLNGSTLQAASGSLGTLVCNATMTSGGGDHDFGLINGIVDGNNNALNGNGLVEWAWSTRPVLNRVRVQNCVYVGFFGYGNTQGDYDYLVADTITGQGFELGNPFANAAESYARIGKLTARNTTAWPTNSFNFPGNSIYAVLTDSTVDALIAYNCAAGVKIDRPSSDVTIGTVFGNICGASSLNSGLKIQGGEVGSSANVSTYPMRVHVGLVHMIAQGGEGLYMERCIDCTVVSYIGESNSTGGNNPDVWIGGTRDTVLSIKSSDANNIAVSTRSYASGYRLGTVVIKNANRGNTASVAALSVQGGVGRIQSLSVIDALASPDNVSATATAGGGTFAGSVTRYYMLTYTNANGETVASEEVSATPAAGGSVNIAWTTGTLPSGVTNTKIYCSAISQSENTTPALLAVVAASATTYTDTGSAPSTGALPAYNSASTGLTPYGAAVTSTFAQIRISEMEITGTTTPTSIVNSALVRIQTVVSGPPWIGQMVLNSEAMPAVGASYGKILKSGTYNGADFTNLVATSQPAYGIPVAAPFALANNITVAEIGLNVGTAGDTGSTIQLCIWADDGNGEPGPLVLAAGTISGITTGYQGITGLSTALSAGRYWLGCISQYSGTSTTAPKVYGSSGQVFPLPNANSGTNATTVTNTSGVQGASQGNGAPGVFSGVNAAANTPKVVIKAQ